MKILYVIGNGFDIAHGLDTSYWNFREYLDDIYPEFLQEFRWQLFCRNQEHKYGRKSA